MNEKCVLREKDMLSPTHFPVIAVFNMVDDDRFLTVLEGVSKGVGFGENFGACVFPGDLDEYDRKIYGEIDGVEFGLHDGEEVTISYAELLCYLELLCQKYKSIYPKQKEQVEFLLNRFRQKFIT